MKKLMMAAMVAAAAMAATADDYGFTYQAELKNDKGQALSSRNQTVEIRLWKTATGTGAGDLLWGRTYNIYTDENGLFNQEISDSLGSRTSDGPNMKLSQVFCNNGAGTVYLGLKVKDSAGEISPRQRLFAVPFAGRANSANNLVGDSHTVEGTLNLVTTNATLSASGLVLQPSSVSTVGDLTAENLTVKNDVTFSGNLQYNGTLSGGDGKSIVPVPIGGIIMWTKNDLPDSEHWAVCDGKNGTPDLRDRFIVGAGSKYGLGKTGGEETHKLTTDEIPAHDHHVRKEEKWNRVGVDLDLHQVFLSVANYYWETTDWKEKDYVKSNAYTRVLDVYTASAGGGQAHENRPPYYALYYIMRVK